MIYKGNRIINWCPVCQTSISDAEVEHEEQAGHFWHIRYQIAGSNEFVEIATTTAPYSFKKSMVTIKETMVPIIVDINCIVFFRSEENIEPKKPTKAP